MDLAHLLAQAPHQLRQAVIADAALEDAVFGPYCPDQVVFFAHLLRVRQEIFPQQVLFGGQLGGVDCLRVRLAERAAGCRSVRRGAALPASGWSAQNSSTRCGRPDAGQIGQFQRAASSVCFAHCPQEGRVAPERRAIFLDRFFIPGQTFPVGIASDVPARCRSRSAGPSQIGVGEEQLCQLVMRLERAAGGEDIGQVIFVGIAQGAQVAECRAGVSGDSASSIEAVQQQTQRCDRPVAVAAVLPGQPSSSAAVL